MARLDCQHRLHSTDQLDVKLPFVIYQDLSKDEEITIFTTINDEHMGLAKSLVDAHTLTLTGKDDARKNEPHLAIAADLNDDKKSPWYQSVNSGGISKSTPGTKRRITLRTFQVAIKDLISGPRCQNAAYETKYEAVKNFWEAVKLTFPDAWKDHRKHMLIKGVGIAAMADLGRDVIQECLAKNDISVDAMAVYIEKLEGFDFRNKTSPLSLIGGQKGAAAAAKAFKAVVFGETSLGAIGDLLMPSSTA